MTTAMDFFLDTLEELGIDSVFGVPGQAIMPLYNALHDRGSPRSILTAHETGAGFAASAWAQIRGTVGVCCATTGPGALNLMTGVATAYSESIPLLAVTGQAPLSAFGTRAYQESTRHKRGVDTVAAFEPITKSSSLATSPEHLIRLLSSGIKLAREGRPGPVHISVPREIWNRSVDTPFLDRIRRSISERPSGVMPPSEAIRKLADDLRLAAKPVILAGHGVASARAGDEVLAFAEAWQIPVITTVRGKGGVPSTSPLVIGHLGAGGDPELSAWWAGGPIDLLLAVGTSLGPMALGGVSAGQVPERIVSINIDPEEHSGIWPVDRVVRGDISVVLGELTKLAPAITEPRPSLLPRARGPKLEDFPREVGGMLHPGSALCAVRDSLPAGARILPDSGSHWIWSMHLFQARFGNAIIPGRSLGAMGQGLAASIGAKLAEPERPVIAITGDGSFLMHGGEVATAVNHNIPVVWVVVNDAALGRIRTAQIRDFDGRVISTELPEMNLAQVATGLGLWARRLQNIEEIGPAVREAISRNVPALLELRVGRTDPPLGG